MVEPEPVRSRYRKALHSTSAKASWPGQQPSGSSATSGALTTNSDGASPYAALILSGTTLYGTAPYGGEAGHGTVFKINVDDSGFIVLHTFTATLEAIIRSALDAVTGVCLKKNGARRELPRSPF